MEVKSLIKINRKSVSSDGEGTGGHGNERSLDGNDSVDVRIVQVAAQVKI
jgi:hypothetical protein